MIQLISVKDLKKAALQDGGDLEAMAIDEDFIRALEYGMPLLLE